jgi:putative transferase (TIGR04331 family)
MLLVTTKIDLSTIDENVLLLGSWCKSYSDIKLATHRCLENMPHRWEVFEVLKCDYHYMSKLYERILKAVSIELNKVHSIQRSSRYWRILLGPWLDSCITVFLDRWFAVKYAIDNYDITRVTVSCINESLIVPSDCIDYLNMVFDDEWNFQIYSLVASYFSNMTGIELLQVKPVKSTQLLYRHNKSRFFSIRALSHTIFDISKRFILPFLSDDRYLIMPGSLSLKNEIKLNLGLGQLPLKYANPLRVNQPPINGSLRKSFSLTTFSPLSHFEKALSECLIKIMPIAYLEGFKSMNLRLNSLPYPKKPKAIFSTTSLIYDDFFKLYAAEVSDKGARIIYGQHGGYGVPMFMRAEDLEKAFCDRYLTWGWTDDSGKTYPVGLIKAGSVRKKVRSNPSSLLLIRGLVGRYKFRIDSGSGLNQDLAIESCITLAKLLPSLLRKQLLVRLYFNDYGFKEEARWKDYCPEASIKQGNENLQDLLSISRLVIYSYNVSTGWMEYMAAGIPVILFWDAKSSPVRDNVQPYFDEFKSVGIFHDTPHSASSHIIRIWNDVSGWWNSHEVNKAKSNFMNTYCNPNLDVVAEIKKNIVQESSHCLSD